MKRSFDILGAALGLTVTLPVLLVFMVLVWLQDFRSPLYVAPRVRRRGEIFRMVKLRSMVAGADKIGGTSTASSDRRITWVGRLIRKCKLDELTQLWNVLKGDMSLVGPRPQVQSGVDLYTEEEQRLLTVRPGITDFASIVFADEGEILRGAEDADLKYDQVIRPWKSRLGLVYVDHHSLFLDLQLVVLTVVGLFSRRTALSGVHQILRGLQISPEVVEVARRSAPLYPSPPPGDFKGERRV